MLVRLPDENVGVVLCYDNPVYEEEEQELPFLRWNRYVHIDEEERFIEKMTLIVISKSNPEVLHGSVHCNNDDEGETSLWFRKSSGDTVLLKEMDALNKSIEEQFDCQGQLSAIPIWNSSEVMLGRLSILDHEEELSGEVFVREWIGILAVSLFHVTKVFLNNICNSKSKMSVARQNIGAQKSPKPSQKLFWIWWPPIKPRDLGVFLREMGSQQSISMKFFRANPPVVSGIYRASFAEITTRGKKSWVLKIHADREATIPVFFDPDEVGNGDNEKVEYEPDSEEVRVVFNRNFTLSHGFKEGTNMCGIFGSLGYVTAQLLPYRKDNVCPMFPCLSPWGSLHDFKTVVASTKEIPPLVENIISRASRLRSAFCEVLKENFSDEDMDYFEN